MGLSVIFGEMRAAAGAFPRWSGCLLARECASLHELLRKSLAGYDVLYLKDRLDISQVRSARGRSARVKPLDGWKSSLGTM
jgi:hypothetical protein